MEITCRNLKIPLYDRIINLGLYSYEATSLLIDKINPEEREWGKTKVLINDYMYMVFLKKITNANEREIIGYLSEFYEDSVFKKEFQKKLGILETGSNWGDIRFHSLTIYVVVRAICPDIVVETGVASGKSSALILCAMNHNNKGKLISIELPNEEGRQLADGAKTTTHQYEVGWLVPSYLRDRWRLNLGNSLDVLPEVLRELEYVDIFLHDSLHTYEHVKSELAFVFPKIRKGGVILCDNTNLGAGEAFNEFLAAKSLVGYAYRDLGAVLLSRVETGNTR